jgi:CDGSH-type Zn-finger protein/uncharacterized Fe-S cluster protein YjdI
MKKKVHSYQAEGIVVEYDAARCIHVKECVHGLPEVFDPKRRPWIDPGLASADAIAEVVRRCPTGALRYRTETGEQEQPTGRNEVRTAADGPLYLHGRLNVRVSDGESVEETRLALCRCGASQNKPFCDNAHIESGFRDPAANIPQQVAKGSDEKTTVAVTFVPNGPILIDGPVAVCGADSSEAVGVRGALCRCGESLTKPFCDGSHVAAGFSSD